MGDLRQELEAIVESAYEGHGLQPADAHWVAKAAVDTLDFNERLHGTALHAIKGQTEAREVALWLAERGELPTRHELDKYPWNVPFVREWLKRKGCDTVAQTEE